MARESALNFNPHAKIVAHHGNIKTNEYGPEYFKQFTLVMNALDNLGPLTCPSTRSLALLSIHFAAGVHAAHRVCVLSRTEQTPADTSIGCASPPMSLSSRVARRVTWAR